ncbi:MAG TPA: DUF4038 domain-containing protein [Methylocella sp.]|nr:DUF4038 domain-containing protein [Methylocella sp.]
MYGEARGSGRGYSLWVFEVYGTLTLTAPPPAAAFPVKRGASGRFLAGQNNKPFLVTADSLQSIAANLSEAQADTYFANRKALDFNAASINVFAFYSFYPSPSRSDGATCDGIIRPLTGHVASGTDGIHYDVRRKAYWAMLCGGAGQFYGNAHIRTFKTGWNNNLNKPGAALISCLKRFFSSLAWHNLVPDQTHALVTAGYGSPGNGSTRVSQSDNCAASMTPDGTRGAAYMPAARTITVNMSKLSKAVTASWLDPADKTAAAIPGSPFVNRGTGQFTPPAKNSAKDSDWVLVLR